MELFFVRWWRGIRGSTAWSIGWTGMVDRYPAITYRCPACKNIGGSQDWVAGTKGFQGVVPVPHCCANAIPYPVENDEYLAHLSAKPRFSPDAGTPVTFERKSWDGEFEYNGSRTRGMWE